MYPCWPFDSALWHVDRVQGCAVSDKTYGDLRVQYRDAKIVAVDPSADGDVDTAAVGFDSAVQNAAERVGATYVSLIAPNVLTPDMFADDGSHVQDTGHPGIADRVLSQSNSSSQAPSAAGRAVILHDAS